MFASLWDLFHKGSAVANPAAWKNGQITVNLLAAFLIGLLQLGSSWFPVLSTIPSDAVTAVAGGILGIYNAIVTVISSQKVGLK